MSEGSLNPYGFLKRSCTVPASPAAKCYILGRGCDTHVLCLPVENGPQYRGLGFGGHVKKLSSGTYIDSLV